MIYIKICQYCGNEIKNPTHWNQKYHREPQNNNVESCSELARKENKCIDVRNYRKRFGRGNENIIGSRNANLGASALNDFDAELAIVHREKVRLLGQ